MGHEWADEAINSNNPNKGKFPLDKILLLLKKFFLFCWRKFIVILVACAIAVGLLVVLDDKDLEKVNDFGEDVKSSVNTFVEERVVPRAQKAAEAYESWKGEPATSEENSATKEASVGE